MKLIVEHNHLNLNSWTIVRLHLFYLFVLLDCWGKSRCIFLCEKDKLHFYAKKCIITWFLGCELNETSLVECLTLSYNPSRNVKAAYTISCKS